MGFVLARKLEDGRGTTDHTINKGSILKHNVIHH